MLMEYDNQDIVWNRHGNPEPWNKVEVSRRHHIGWLFHTHANGFISTPQPGTNTKMMQVNSKLDKEYKREQVGGCTSIEDTYLYSIADYLSLFSSGKSP